MGGTEPDYDADNPIYRAGQPVEETEYLTDAFTREAVDFIDRNADKPFFLYLAYNAVHSPLQGANEYMKRFSHIEDIQRRIFAAMLANLDDSVGAVLNKLREKDVERDTLVIFLSDNGGPTRELTSSNLPLRDGKGSMYEGGLRIPFMMQWRGQLPAGSVYQQPVISLDIFATAIHIANATVDRRFKPDGVNLIPYLTGHNEERPHEQLYWRTGKKTAIRVGDWKLVRNPGRKQSPDWQVYNLAKDISEQNNLATEDPTRTQSLIEKWEAMDSQMIDPVWSR